MTIHHDVEMRTLQVAVNGVSNDENGGSWDRHASGAAVSDFKKLFSFYI